MWTRVSLVNSEEQTAHLGCYYNYKHMRSHYQIFKLKRFQKAQIHWIWGRSRFCFFKVGFVVQPVKLSLLPVQTILLFYNENTHNINVVSAKNVLGDFLCTLTNRISLHFISIRNWGLIIRLFYPSHQFKIFTSFQKKIYILPLFNITEGLYSNKCIIKT